MVSNWSIWQRLLGGSAFVLVLLLGVVGAWTWQVESRQLETEPVDLRVPAEAPQRLAQALRAKTLTNRDPAQLDSSAFQGLYNHFREAFPRVHATLDVDTVNGLSRLYTWEGRTPSLAPVVLMAHVDVVPVEDPSEWPHPPFAGRIAENHVWGRGALDDKASAVGILEAIETLLKRSVPQRHVHGAARGHAPLQERLNGLQDANSARLVVEGPASPHVVPGDASRKRRVRPLGQIFDGHHVDVGHEDQIGRASCRERV